MDQFYIINVYSRLSATGNPWEIQKQGQQAKNRIPLFKEMLEQKINEESRLFSQAR